MSVGSPPASVPSLASAVEDVLHAAWANGEQDVCVMLFASGQQLADTDQVRDLDQIETY